MKQAVDTLTLPSNSFKFKHQLKNYVELEKFAFPNQISKNLVPDQDQKRIFKPKIVREQEHKTNDSKTKVILFFHQNHPKSKSLAKFLHKTLKGHNFDKLLDHSVTLNKKLHPHDLIKIESITENKSFLIKNLSKFVSPKNNSITQTPNNEKSQKPDDLNLNENNFSKNLNLNDDLGHGIFGDTVEQCNFCEQNLTKKQLIAELKSNFVYKTVDLDKYCFRSDSKIRNELMEKFKINNNYAPILQFYQNGALLREFHNVDLVNQLSRENDKRMILEYFYQLVVKENSAKYADQVNNLFLRAESCHDCKVVILE